MAIFEKIDIVEFLKMNKVHENNLIDGEPMSQMNMNGQSQYQTLKSEINEADQQILEKNLAEKIEAKHKERVKAYTDRYENLHVSQNKKEFCSDREIEMAEFDKYYDQNYKDMFGGGDKLVKKSDDSDKPIYSREFVEYQKNSSKKSFGGMSDDSQPIERNKLPECKEKFKK